MIWGSQWDAAMRWMYNSGNEEKKKYTYDSRGKGNYSSDSPIATGSIEAYAVNNIYDMAGNICYYYRKYKRSKVSHFC